MDFGYCWGEKFQEVFKFHPENASNQEFGTFARI